MGSAQGPVTSELEQARTAPEFGAYTPLAEKLLAVAIRAQNFTGSSGVAIALTEGQEMVCRANWGTSAPEVGTKLSLEHSFTGLCVRTGEPLRCDDAQSDPRVDPEACRALGISAIAAAPVRRGLKVIGVIAAFSDTPNAFADKHLLILTTLADVIVEILDDPHPVQPLPQAVAAAPDLARAAAVAQAPVAPLVDTAAVTTVVQKPAAPVATAGVFELEGVSGRERFGAQRREREPAAEIPSPGEGPQTKPVALPSSEPEPPAAATPSAAAIKAPALPQSPRPATTASSKVSGRPAPHDDVSDLFEAPPAKKKDEVLPAAMDPGPPPQQTKAALAGNSGSARLALVKQPATTPVADASAADTFRFGGFEADSSPHRRWLLVAVVAIFAVIAIAGWRLHEARNASTTKPAPAAAAPEAQATAASEPEPAPEAKPPAPAPAEPKHSPFRPPPMADVVPPPVRIAPPPPDVTIRRSPQPVIEAGEAVRRPAATAASRTAQVPEAQAPQLAPSAPELPTALAKPTPAAVAAPVSRIVAAQLVHRVEPIYPEAARRLQISGKVVLKATITRAGTVSDVKWVSGNDLFRDTSIAAVKQWRYKPASLNGQPVESDLEIVLQFKRPTVQ